VLTALVVGGGCAAHLPLHSKPALVIPRECLTDVHLDDATKCRWDEKEKVWKCAPLVIDKLKGCDPRLEVPPKSSK